MRKITEILFAIGMCLVLPAGIFGVVYELFIWNKSIIPSWLFNTVMIVGTIGILCIIPFVIYNSKRRKMDWMKKIWQNHGFLSRGFRIFIFALVGDGTHDIPPFLTRTTKQSISLSFWAEKTAKRFAKSKFCGLSEANEQNQGAKAPQGYGLEFGWLFVSM